MEEAATKFSHLVEQQAEDFQELPLEVVRELLGNDHLEVPSEDTVLNVLPLFPPFPPGSVPWPCSTFGNSGPCKRPLPSVEWPAYTPEGTFSWSEFVAASTVFVYKSFFVLTGSSCV